MSSIILAGEEIIALTGKRRSDAQRRALDRMGVRYAVRPDGSLAVLRAHVERILDVVEFTKMREPQLHL